MVCVGWDVGVVVLRVVCDPLGVVVLWLVEGREVVVVPEPCEPGVEVLVVEMTCGMNGSLAWKVERKSKTTTLVVVVVAGTGVAVTATAGAEERVFPHSRRPKADTQPK